MAEYVARVRVWHSVLDEYIEPGQVVGFNHPDEETVRALVNQGVIEEVGNGDYAEGYETGDLE